MRRSRLVLGVAIALLIGTSGPTAGPTRAQEAVDWSGWIALQVWDCPSGMTVDSFDAWSCWLSEGEYDVYLADADWNPLLGLGSAYFDGWTYTWQYLPVGPEWAPTPFRIVQAAPPAGSVGWIVRYAMDAGAAETVWLSDSAFGADLHVYNFYP
jgi:hypothetical protein